jgi:hypothetical protein
MIMFQSMDVWQLYPTFLQECYGTEEPEMMTDAPEVAMKFHNWLVNNKDYDFNRITEDGEAAESFWSVVSLCAKRRIMERKYIILMEEGRDTFVDSDIREEVVRRVREGKWLIGQ